MTFGEDTTDETNTADGTNATDGTETTFAELFDRAAAYDVDEDAVRRALATRRTEEDADG